MASHPPTTNLTLPIQTILLLINSELDQHINLYWNLNLQRPSVRNRVKHLWLLIWIQGLRFKVRWGQKIEYGILLQFTLNYHFTEIKGLHNCEWSVPWHARHSKSPTQEGNQTSSIRYAFETGKVSKKQGNFTILSLYEDSVSSWKSSLRL